VTDGFDSVAVRIQYEGGIVMRMIMRAAPRRSVVPAARGDGVSMKAVDGRRGSLQSTLVW
jgi:hypothetical protein